MIKSLLVLFLLSFSINLWSSTDCLESSEVEEVLPYFKQFNSLKEKSIGNICLESLEEKRDQQSFHVLKSLILLKKLDTKLSNQNLSDLDIKDEMNFKAVSNLENNSWWKYFTDRADNFNIDPPRCFFSHGTIAYVYGDSKSKTVNICPLYFKTSIIEQVETLLHEVRHFDGFAHVACVDGIYKGRGNHCDESILDGGSYAVTIQILMALSKLDSTTREERYLLESLAVGRINNNFNKKVKTKVTSYVYLSNEKGEVYRSDIKKIKDIEFVKKLKTPSLVYSAGREFVTVPLDRNQDAIRFDKKFQYEISEIGAFAGQYNSESASQRELYTQFDYFEDSGFLKDGEYYNRCGNRIEKFDAKGIKFISMIKLNNKLGKKEAYLIDVGGEAYRLTCIPGIVSRTEVLKANFKMPNDLVGGVSLNNKNAVILTTQGEVLKLNIKNQKTSPVGIMQRDWLSITIQDVYGVFE